MNLFQVVRFWLDNARKVALPQSLFPAVVALTMAGTQEGFSWGLGLLAVLGVVLGHLGLNLFDDYFDYRKNDTSFRDRMASEGFRARIAKCEYLTSGRATVGELLVACCVFSGLALFAGGVIFAFRGKAILYLALAAGVLGISYSGAPLRLSYRGMGELLIGLMFGPMVMMGVYVSACGVWDWSVLLVSLPVGLLVTNIVYSHAILDYEPDKRIGKRTLAVLIDRPRGMLVVSFVCNFLPFLIVIGGVIAGLLPIALLGVLLVLPLAVSLYGLMVGYVRNPQRRYVRRWWMGPMENWASIEELGLAWFMIRWYSARNLITFFCILVIIIYIVLV